ncbi:hypothetical protein [Desulfosudis oleivorans]|uniref:Uncharacterized protein n=1 Tax=Desulfosudis oleivorans (strain DSM 6200 / JCM 39069 / Hxd3) TaxID=96561 RepID=A8ZW99_DESOH|nr:hypothetical protein [Desulfosudis oleivorans]ABW68333.1 hypothetical protein Dole_2529 [Desulfosudis oleivorans Hxd3]
MHLFTRLMGLFWLFAEGLIMVWVRGGLAYLETGRSRQRIYILCCLALFVTIVSLYAGKSFFLDRLRIGPDTVTAVLYNRYLWNFICTLWVLIEGAIAVYVFRIYRLLKNPTSPGPRFPGWGMALLCVLFLAGFGLYHGYLHFLVDRSALSGQAIVNILRFYIKTCGVFWILIEWIVALIGVKTYLVLKGGPHAPVTG